MNIICEELVATQSTNLQKWIVIGIELGNFLNHNFELQSFTKIPSRKIHHKLSFKIGEE